MAQIWFAFPALQLRNYFAEPLICIPASCKKENDILKTYIPNTHKHIYIAASLNTIKDSTYFFEASFLRDVVRTVSIKSTML